ncbi:MAG: leucine-rich repeat protein [Acutalibacteraceae bacterium]
MDKSIIISYFKLNEKERQENFLTNSTQEIIKTKHFAIGKAHFVFLNDDGRVIAYGDNSCGQCDTQGWENVSKVVAGDYHTAALLRDGTVVATGDNTHGQCNVGEWKNITDIYAVNHLTVGVQADGTVTVAARTQQNENNGQPQPINNTTNIPNPNQTKPSGYRECIDFERIEKKDGITITKYRGSEETVVIPETIEGKPVRVIGDSAFKYNSDVKHVILPENLRVIAINAFSYCTNLENVEIPHGTEEIGVLSFFSCSKIQKMIIPDSVKEIGSYAFGDCKNLREVVIPDSVQSVGICAFNDCKKLKKVNISPQTRERLDPRGEILPKSEQSEPSDYSDFEWIEEENRIIITKYKGNAETVFVPETIQNKPVREIGFHAFWDNSTAKHLVLPKNLRVICDRAFDLCDNLEKLEIPYGTEKIGSFSFVFCRKLEILTLPQSVKEIGSHAFAKCTNLRKIVIPDSIQTISKYAFDSCTKAKEIIISPQTRERIDPRGEILPK